MEKSKKSSVIYATGADDVIPSSDDAGISHYVDDFAPNEYYDKNSYAVIPVYVRPYHKKNGDLAYTLSVKKGRIITKGEEF